MVRKIPVAGTTVKVSISDDRRKNGFKPLPEGLEVKVVEYSTIHYGRTCGFDKGGTYQNEQYLTVEDAAGNRIQLPSDCVAPIEGISEMMDMRKKEQRRLGELPDTKFWETDTVMDEEGEVFKIQNIWYDQIGEFCNDGVTPMSIYACGVDGNGVTYRREESLTLVERGNVWKRAHGEEMFFLSTQDEIDFHIKVGDAKEMPNPRLETGRYHWSKHDALESIRDGYGHYYFDKAHPSVFEFEDEKIGAMAREYWLKHNDPKYDHDQAASPSM